MIAALAWPTKQILRILIDSIICFGHWVSTVGLDDYLRNCFEALYLYFFGRRPRGDRVGLRKCVERALNHVGTWYKRLIDIFQIGGPSALVLYGWRRQVIGQPYPKTCQLKTF